MIAGSNATNRVGFGKKYKNNEIFADDLRDGAAYVFELFREVDGIANWFDNLPPDAYARDVARFSKTLAVMYGQGR